MRLNIDTEAPLQRAHSTHRPDTAQTAAGKEGVVSAAPAPDPQGGRSDALHLADIRERVAELNRIEALRAHRLEFSVHKATGRMVIRVMDSETDEMVRQLPAEEFLKVAEKLDLGKPGSLSDSAA